MLINISYTSLLFTILYLLYGYRNTFFSIFYINKYTLDENPFFIIIFSIILFFFVTFVIFLCYFILLYNIIII
jgi:hypothetical protein